MKNINWGIIGCGEVAEKRNGPAFNEISGSRLVAVVRRNGEKTEVLKQHPTQKLTVAHYRRVLPLFLKVKEFIDNRLVGDIRTVQIRTWQNKDKVT